MTNRNRNRIKVRATSLTALLVSILILSTLVGLQFIGKVAAQDYPYDWPMFGHDPQHTGYTESPAPNTNQTLWTATLGVGAGTHPIVAENKLFIGAWDKRFYCFDATDGNQLWNYTTDGMVYANSAYADGRVYLGSTDNNLYCWNATTGALIWNYTMTDWAGAPTIVDGRVYCGSDNYNTYCFDAVTGALIWNYTTGGMVVSAPAVAYDRVYVGCVEDHNIYCFDAATGVKIWNYTTDGEAWSTPAVAYGRVYVGSDDFNVYCLDADTGEKIWNYATGDVINLCSPAVADGKVYIGSYDDTVYCLDADTGEKIWNYTTSADIYGSPAVADGKVYATSLTEGKVYCLDAATGAYIWSYETGSTMLYGGAVVANGVVYLVSGNTVYAFSDLDAPIPAQYDWDVGIEVGDTFRYKGTLVSWESENASFPPTSNLEYLQPWNASDWLEYKVTDIEELIVTFEVTTHWKNGTETVDTLEEDMTSTIPIAVIGANLVEGTEIRPEALYFGQTLPARYLNASVMREYESGSKETNVVIFDWNFFGAVYNFEYLFDKETGIKVYFQSSSTNAFDTGGNNFSYNCTLELIETNVEGWTVIPEFPTGTVMLIIFVAVTVSICIMRKQPKWKRW